MDNLTWQWITRDKLLVGENPLQLDCGVLPVTGQPKRTISSLEFSPSTGEFLLSANMDRASVFSFDYYRLQAAKSASSSSSHVRDGSTAEVDIEFLEEDGRTPAVVELVRWNPWDETQFTATLPALRKVCTMDVETGLELHRRHELLAGASTTRGGGYPTCVAHLDVNLLVVGTSTGSVLGHDARVRQGGGVFTHEQPGKHPVVAIQPNRLSSSSSSGGGGNSFLAAFGNGEMAEFSGSRQAQQAFASTKLPILNQTRRAASRVGICAVASGGDDSSSIAVYCTDGSIQRFNPVWFQFAASTLPLKQPDGRGAHEVQYYHPQAAAITAAAQQQQLQHSLHMTTFKSCIAFAPRSSHVFAVNRLDLCRVEAYDWYGAKKDGGKTDGGNKEWKRLGGGTTQSTTMEAVQSYEFKRHVSAIAVHPDSDVLVCALQKSSMLNVCGLL